jgi:tRNA U34 5-methylaminomethyl-2-thiouridine-forming methyltransferase MnmC
MVAGKRKKMAEIVRTEDGSDTLYVSELDEHYHSVHGAIQESEHIFINSGFDFSEANPIRILEIGFGTGLNALLTCIHSEKLNRKVYYSSVEKYPLPPEITSSLNYPDMLKGDSRLLFDKIHGCRWNSLVQLTRNFTLNKIEGDLLSLNIDGTFDLVYFDAFGPDKQPGMWSDDIFAMIGAATCRGGILVTYSVKGSVQRSLKRSGFNITLLPGPPGKRQILRAIKS